MGTAEIEAAINAIPAKKDDLRKAFEVLQSYSFTLASFTLMRKGIEDHFSYIENSIEEQDKRDVESYSELKSRCLKMDGKGLRSYIIENREDLPMILNVLKPALRSAPDPAILVLDSMEGFVPSKVVNLGEVHGIRTTCVSILECLYVLAPEIKPIARERAREVAMKCKRLITDGKGDNWLLVLNFLHLVVTYGLSESF